MVKRLGSYLLNVGIAIDRLCAALIGWGYQFTISARCATVRRECAFCRAICKWLNKIEPDHCAKWARKEGAV